MNLPCLRWNLITCLLFITYFAKAQTDSLQSCSNACCVIDPTPAGIMVSNLHTKKELMFSYKFMHMNMGKMISGSSTFSDKKVYQNYLMASEKMYMNMHMVMAMYGLSNKITLMGMVSFNSISMTMLRNNGIIHKHAPSSSQVFMAPMDERIENNHIGDPELHALIRIIKGTHHQLILNAGISIPLGSVEGKGKQNSMYPEKRLPYIMQIGSGTLDLLPGLTWLYYNRKTTLSSQITTSIRTGYNKLGYKLGNEFILNNWVAYQIIPFVSSSIRLESSISGLIQGNDISIFPGMEPAANPSNYGGKKMVGFIGFNIHLNEIFKRSFTVGAEFGLPVYQYVNGIQMKSNHFINLSANVLF